MKSISQKTVFRQYYFRCLLIFMIYIAIVVSCIYIYPNIWSVVFCTALYFPVKIFIRISANKTIASVLFDDLNALQFQQIINSNKHFIPPLSYRINAAIFTGEFQTVVNIVFLQMSKKRCSVREKQFYLGVLAWVYFQLRDFEKLKIALSKYEELKALYPQKNFLSTPNSAVSYYRYFLEKNYEACKTVCKERNMGFRLKAWDIKISKLQNDFFYAVACYELGEIDIAKSSFKNIISYAPQMYVSIVAQKYLEAIENNQTLLISDDVVLPDDGYQIHDERTASKIRLHKIIMRIGLIVVAVLLVLSTVIDYIDKKQQDEVDCFSGCTQKNTEMIENFQNYKSDFNEINQLLIQFIDEGKVGFYAVVEDNEKRIINLYFNGDSIKLNYSQLKAINNIKQLFKLGFSYIDVSTDRITYGALGNEMYVYIVNGDAPQYFYSQEHKDEIYVLSDNWFYLKLQ